MLAIPTLDSLWESEPGDPEIALELAKMYQLLGQHNKALDVLKKAIENSTGSKKELKISYAVALHKANNHQQGEKEFELLEIQYPLDAEVYYSKAMVYIEHNDWGGLTRLIESGFNEQKQNLRVILNIANSLATSNKSEARIYADRIYKKLIEENPKDIQTMISFGMHLQQSKRMDEAYEVYNKILEIDSDNEFAVNNLAWILCEDKHDYSKALELTQTGLKKYPDYIDLIDTQGVIFYRMGRTGEAIANFDKCIGLYLPNTSSLTASYFHLARCYNDIGRKDEAVKYMRTALDSNLKQRGLSDKEVTEAKSVIKQLTGG
jgi:tetratricopeptide (TPR) repeat protein